MKPKDLIWRLETLIAQLTHGCGNHSCCILQPKGLGTNNICKCNPGSMARELRRIGVELEKQARWDLES